MEVQRFIDFKIDEKNWEQTPEGYLRIKGVEVTKPGVFPYNGGKVQELRPPEEVFHNDSIESLRSKPITNNHPFDGNQKVYIKADNYRRYAKGFVESQPKQDGGVLKTDVLITDSDLVDEVLHKGKRQLSCGYLCKIEKVDGVHEGKPYNSKQTNIRYNHLAVVDAGRMGTSELRLDENDNQIVENQMPDPVVLIQMKFDAVEIGSLKFDGIDAQIPKELAEPFNRLLSHINRAVSGIRTLSTEKAELQGRFDGQKEKLEKAEKEKITPEIMQKAIKGRLKLQLAGAFYKIDSKEVEKLGDLDLMKAIITKVYPKIDLSKAEESYIRGRFDTLLEDVNKAGKGFEDLMKLAQGLKLDDMMGAGDQDGRSKSWFESHGGDTHASPMPSYREKFMNISTESWRHKGDKGEERDDFGEHDLTDKEKFKQTRQQEGRTEI